MLFWPLMMMMALLAVDAQEGWRLMMWTESFEFNGHHPPPSRQLDGLAVVEKATGARIFEMRMSAGAGSDVDYVDYATMTLDDGDVEVLTMNENYASIDGILSVTPKVIAKGLKTFPGVVVDTKEFKLNLLVVSKNNARYLDFFFDRFENLETFTTQRTNIVQHTFGREYHRRWQNLKHRLITGVVE